MNLRRRAMSGVFWSAALSFGTQASGFILASGLAHVFGKAAFGEWSIIQGTVGTIAGVAQLSMAVTATKYVAQYRTGDPERVGSILGLCSAVTVVTGALAAIGLIMAAGPLARETLHAPHIADPLRISAAGLFFLTVNGYQLGALSGFERFRSLAILGLLYGLVSVAAVLALGAAFGLNAAIAALSACTALNWAMHHRVLGRYCALQGIRVGYRRLRSEWPVLTTFTLPATLAGVAGGLGVWLSSVFLVQQAGGYEQLAVFAAAGSFKTVILFMPTVVSRVTMPLLVNLFGQDSQDRYMTAYSKSLWAMTGAALAAAVPIAVAAPWLLLAFGKSFRDGAGVVAIVAIATVFEVAALGLYQTIFSAGWMWSGFSIAAWRALILAAGTAVAAPAFGAVGAAYATLASQAFGLALTVWILHRARVRVWA